ncbi:heterokaryon incompatibility protein-domain-containing protein [Paraphoma chrysanthemicola]|nr:heterokaryon incompatibility protein-domain-containing protein [Paraphoma chrysanthemicola]
MATEHDHYAQMQNASVLASLGHHLITITKSNTQQLLSTASALSQSRKSEAAAIISRLKELNPAVAKQFRPKEDALSRLSLRLISPQVPACGTVPSFVAVSYCWHSPEWVVASAAKPIVPGWKISKPMVDALMGLEFRASEEGVWLDQLCIDQGNEKDKKIHIGAMDVIYRSSRRVVILLEDIQLSEDEERAGRTYATFYEEGCREVKKRDIKGRAKEEFIDGMFPRQEKKYQDRGQGHILAAAESFTLKLLGARWFSRAWCAHESRMAPYQPPNNALLLCYGHLGKIVSFEFRFIHYMSFYLSFVLPDMRQQMIEPDYQHLMNDPDPKSLRERCWRINRRMAMERPNVSSMQHLVDVLSSGCSRKGDLISIALNMSSIPLYYKGDVTTVEDVIWLFSLLVLATGDVVPLVVEGSKLKITHGKRKKILSWANYPHQGVLDERLPITDSSLITGVTRDYIELDLLIFKSLPSIPSGESLNLSSRIITQHKLTDIAQDFRMAADQQVRRTVETMKYDLGSNKSDNPGIFTNFHQVWLAQAIDCGLDWILRLPGVLREGTDQTWMYGTIGISSDARLTEAARTLVSHFSDKNKEVDPIPTANQLATVVRFFMCLLDPRLALLNITPRCLPAGPGDFAFTEPVSCRSYIAVPVAIAHLPPWQMRAWIVEPFNPKAKDKNRIISSFFGTVIRREESCSDDNSVPCSSDNGDMRESPDKKRTAWRLRRRQIIFGCQPFQQPIAVDGVSTILLKKQRVYGAEDYVWR